MVFDITFTAAVGPRSMSQEFGVGLLFGMPDESANLTTPGVGGVRVTTTEVAGGRVLLRKRNFRRVHFKRAHYAAAGREDGRQTLSLSRAVL